MFQKHIQHMRGNWLLLIHTQASGLQQAQLREWVIKLLQQLAKGEVEGNGNKGKGNKGKKGKGEHGKGKGQGKVSGEV
jgi:subtilisin-like proprotein convertase family protein